MGARSNTDSIVAILKAFLNQRTWTQAALARHVGVSTPTIHRHLGELQAHGIPLAKEYEHPHVYWSVPKTWYPGGVMFTSEQMTELFRLLSRLPGGTPRNRLLERTLEYLPDAPDPSAWVTFELTSREERHLPVVEDAASQKRVLRFTYFSAHRGTETTRRASVHRVLPGPPARFLATCHRTGKLKWFRLQNVSDSKLDSLEPFRAVPQREIETHLRESLNGFHADERPAKHSFFVRDPDARWVARNLIAGMRVEEATDGIRVDVETAALKRLARFVVGLGDAAKPLTVELRAEVATRARGALGVSRRSRGA